ncbi:MAG: hypothetical protein AB7S75_07355 [Desulfococcaceae bacterium]
MTIQRTTIRKFFREHFTGNSPIRIGTGERETLAKKIRQRISGIADVRISERPYYISEKHKDRYVCGFTIEEPDSRHYYHYRDSFSLILDEQGNLTIEEGYSQKALVSDLEEIVSFIAACKKRLERQKVLRSKRKKVRDFKSQAIVSQVRRLAKQEKFDFCTATDNVKLKLFVKLSETECIELQIPFSKFQEILPNLRSAVLALREMTSTGIKFRIRGVSSYHHTWITHSSIKEDLEEDEYTD